jgi:hypothetical protein
MDDIGNMAREKVFPATITTGAGVVAAVYLPPAIP